MEVEKRIPTHVSIIMDGNGRWARERGRERVFGHFEGVESVRACTEASVEAGVRYLSLFAFSEENWGRPGDEVDALMKLMFKSMVEEFTTFMENRVRFVVLGNRARLSDTLNAAIDDMMDKTVSNDRLTLILSSATAANGTYSRLPNPSPGSMLPVRKRLTDWTLRTSIRTW